MACLNCTNQISDWDLVIRSTNQVLPSIGLCCSYIWPLIQKLLRYLLEKNCKNNYPCFVLIVVRKYLTVNIWFRRRTHANCSYVRNRFQTQPPFSLKWNVNKIANYFYLMVRDFFCRINKLKTQFQYFSIKYYHFDK